MIRRPPRPPLFPYPPLSRSLADAGRAVEDRDGPRLERERRRVLEVVGVHRLARDGRAIEQDPLAAVHALRQDRHQRRLAADRKSTRLNSSHGYISYAVFCLK